MNHKLDLIHLNIKRSIYVEQDCRRTFKTFTCNHTLI